MKWLRNPLLWLFVLGLIIRFALIFLDYSWDVNNHIVWAFDAIKRGLPALYTTISSNAFGTLYPNYPPLAIFIFMLTYPLQAISHALVWWLNVTIPPFPSNLIFFIETKTFLAGMFKLPAIFADLGLAYLCLLLARRIIPQDKKWQLVAAAGVLFNPAFIFNSSYWGQIDSLPLFFTLLSFYLLIYHRFRLFSALSFLAALLIKPTALVFLPFYGYYFWMKNGTRLTIGAFIICLLLFWFSFLPFYQQGTLIVFPFDIYLNKILATQSLQNINNGAFNFWAIILGNYNAFDTSVIIANITYRLIGQFLTGLAFILIFYRQIKSKSQPISLFTAAFFGSLAAFLFLTKMHERYSLLPLPFLLIMSFKNKKYLPFFVLLSVISYFNHYHSWSVPRIDLFVGLISSMPFIYLASLVNLLIFIYLLTRAQRSY